MTEGEIFLNSTRKLFYNYKQLGDKAIEQTNEQHINWVQNENSNSMAIIVKHISGNMLSRWTDFLTADGEKEWRNRDTEFEGTIDTKEQLLQVWEKGWECLFNAVNPLTPSDLLSTVYIRNEAHSVMDAINRQIAHYSYHVGQIVFLAKLLKEGVWQSLSIPKGKSDEFNNKMRKN